MPVPTGYYDVNRNAIARGMTAPQNPAYSALTPSSIMNSATGGMIGGGISNPNEPDGGWYATNLDTGGSIHPVTGDQYRTLTDSSHSNRDLLQAAAKVAALIYGGAALSGVGAGGAASGISNAGLGFGGSAGAGAATEAGTTGGEAAGLSEVAVPSAGAYLPAESLSSAAAPTLGMTAPAAGGAEVGTGAASGGFDWQGMLKHANPFGGSGEGGSPQYGDYSRIAEQLSRNQLQDQRKQVMAQQQAQGPSLQERRRQRIAALLQAGSPA